MVVHHLFLFLNYLTYILVCLKAIINLNTMFFENTIKKCNLNEQDKNSVFVEF